MRRLVLAALVLTPLACSLTYSPGDYLEPVRSGTTLNDGGLTPETSAPIIEGGGTPVDAGSPDVHIVVFAGRRDPGAGEPTGSVNVAETMLATLHSDGTLTPWTFDVPPPSAAQWTHATIAGGSIYLNNNSIVVHASFTDHVTSAWAQASVPSPPASGIVPWVLDERGLTSGRTPAATNNHVFVAPFSDGGIGSWAAAQSVIPVARGDVTLVRVGDLVYALGGTVPPALLAPAVYFSTVELARRDGMGALGDFATSTSFPAIDGGTYMPYQPIVTANADHLFTLGGFMTTATGSRTANAFASHIADATGTLDPWVQLPPLPAPMSGFGAIATPAWIVLFGGEGADGRAVSAILRLAIHADGTYGDAWEVAGTLPSPRAGVVAVTY